jgi:hypothetical protein
MICPKCGQSGVRRSHPHGIADWTMGLFIQFPYYCGDCKRRFYALRKETSIRLRTPEERKIVAIRRQYKWRQSRPMLFAYGAALLLLAIILYELMQQRI